MKHKKTLTTLLLGLTLTTAAFNTNAKAAEAEGLNINLSDTIATTLSVGASHGKEHITGSNPWGFRPRATADTTTSSGTASVLKVKIDSNNNGTGTSTSGWPSLKSTNKVVSKQLAQHRFHSKNIKIIKVQSAELKLCTFYK